MHDLLSILARHGYLAVFFVVLGEALGFPVPAAIALIAAGAAIASHLLSGPGVLIIAVCAMAMGDTVLYTLGRQTGWGLLGFLCKLSMNPETCILRSAESFYKRGRTTLVLAKFVPGINTMAPPLAGSMKMPLRQFAAFDLIGICLYVFAYSALGFVFRDFVASIVQGLATAGHIVELVIVVCLIAYIAYRAWVFGKYRLSKLVPRVPVEELARRVEAGESAQVMVIDVRSHGYYDSGTERIQGSIRVEPNHLKEEIKNLPRDKDIYVYCT